MEPATGTCFQDRTGFTEFCRYYELGSKKAGIILCIDLSRTWEFQGGFKGLSNVMCYMYIHELKVVPYSLYITAGIRTLEKKYVSISF